MRRLLSFIALGFLLAAFTLFFAGPARAGSVDEKIKMLEEELARLKSEQSELKKEAAVVKDAAAAVPALPTFSYRPGRGVTIEAADRAWSTTISYELMVVVYNHLEGNDARGATVGDIHTRRNRPFWIFCLNNCFYEWGSALDIDTDTTDRVGLQNQWLTVRFQRINPFLPELQYGDRLSGPYGGAISMTPAGSRSSTSSGVLEAGYDMLPDGDANELSRRSLLLQWLRIPVGTGDFSFGVEYKPGAGCEEVSCDTDRKQLQTSLQINPFSRSKNPWLERTRLGVGWQTDSVDTRSAVRGRRLRVRSGFERVGAQTILDTGSATIGDGIHHRVEPGFEWGFGPYKAAALLGWTRYEDRNNVLKGVRGNYWQVWHELFLHSPKGPFTGSAATFGSWQLGFGFTRADAQCSGRALAGIDCVPGGGLAYNSAHLLNRELGLYYYIRSGMRLGVNWYWWTSSNTPFGVQQAIGCKTRPTDPGKDCDWHTINLVLNANF